MNLPPFPFWIDQKYEATRLLGKGGGGVALLANKGDETLAVKLLNLSLVANPDKAIQKFKKEFLTLKKLNHPHVGKLQDFGRDTQTGQYYFAGEYIEGPDIYQFCKKQNPEKIESLFVQALEALHYLHTYAHAGLRHNDIKVANMLVAQNGKSPCLKLIDFGLAALSPLEVKGGTASYMSPEQIGISFPEKAGGKNFPKPDHRTDLYSLGVAWYLCLTGVNPFLMAKDTEATLQRHFGPLPLPPSTYRQAIPEYQDKIILKLLAQNPADRYDSAAEVIRELKFLSGKPYSVIPTSERRFFLPEGEWIGQSQVWQPLKEKLNTLPSLVWIVGERGQGKTKILEHFKNYVQAKEGRFLFLAQSTEEALEEWLTELSRHTEDFRSMAVIAIDDFSEQHPAAPHVEKLLQKIQYARRWRPQQNIPWLFLFTTEPSSETTGSETGLETTTLHLKNFEMEELREMVKNISPHKNALPPEAFIQKLKDHTDGNPLFVSSVLKALGEQGMLWDNSGAWHPTLLENVGVDFNKLPIPQSINTSLEKNWQRLSEGKKRILLWLSCFPEGATFEELAACLPENSPSEMEELLSLGLLVRDSREKFLFKNSFLQRTVYARLLKPQKERFHERIARLLKTEKRSPHQIAHHLARSTGKNRRLQALDVLAEFYTQNGNLKEALEAREEALKLLAKKPAAKQCEVILHKIKLLGRMRKWDEAHALADRSLAKHRSAALLEEKGMILLQQHRPMEARACFEKGLCLIKKGKEKCRERLTLQNRIARTWLEERQLDRAIAIYKTTREEARKLKSAESKELLVNDLGYAYLLNQDAENALASLQEELKFLESGEDKIRLCRGHYLLGETWRRLKKDFNQAVKHYRACEILAEDVKDIDWLMRAYHGLAATYLDRAHEGGQKTAYPQALKYFEQSLALASAIKKDSSRLDAETAAIYLSIGMVHQELGSLKKAQDAYQTILSVLEKKKGRSHLEAIRLCEAYLSMSDCLVAEERWEEAKAFLSKAQTILKGAKGLKEHHFGIQLTRARLLCGLHDWKEAKTCLNTAEKLREKFHIHPTPLSQKYLAELRSCLTKY